MRFLKLMVMVLLAFIPCMALAFEPQSLVGEWKGYWNAETGGDEMSMTITKVEAARVEGTLLVRGPQTYQNRVTPFAGHLLGKILSATTPTQPGSPPIIWSLGINDHGTEMVGQATVSRAATVTLKKTK